MLPVLVPFGWAASTYLYWVRGKRYDIQTEILAGPDPTSSPEAAFMAYEKTWEYEFPFLARMAFHFGMLRAYSIPSIARAVSGSTSTDDSTLARRFEDTDLLLHEITERPLTHPRSQKALQHATKLSSLYNLTNEEYIYILSVLVVEPCRLVERWGYRTLTRKEKEAHFEVWKGIGVRIGVRDVPESFHEMEEFCRTFEEKHQRPSADSNPLATAAIDLFISTLPFKSLHGPLLPFLRKLIHSLLDPQLRTTLNLSPPPYLVSTLASIILQTHAGIVRFLLLPREEPARRTPESAEGVMGRYVPVRNVYGEFYGNGYRIEELGSLSIGEKEGLNFKGRIRKALSMPVMPQNLKLNLSSLSPKKKEYKSQQEDSGIDLTSDHDTTQTHPTLHRRKTISSSSRPPAYSPVDSDDETPTTFRRYTYHENIISPIPKRPVVKELFKGNEEWSDF